MKVAALLVFCTSSLFAGSVLADAEPPVDKSEGAATHSETAETQGEAADTQRENADSKGVDTEAKEGDGGNKVENPKNKGENHKIQAQDTENDGENKTEVGGGSTEKRENKDNLVKKSGQEEEEHFGPTYVIEKIKIKGNKKTKGSLIKRHLPFKRGDQISAWDPRVTMAKYRLLGLGFFRRVALSLTKGSRKGFAVLEVKVTERGTLWVESVFLGASEVTPVWGGVDLAEKNFLGMGIILSGAFVAGTKAKVKGSRPQHAERLRFTDRYFLGSRFSLSLMALYSDASEFFRVSGKNNWSAPGNFRAINYKRYGGTIGTAVDVGQWNRMGVHLRIEGINADLPMGLTRTYPDGTTSGINYHLNPGNSYLSSLVANFTRDRRDEAIFPTRGYRIDVTGELASEVIGSSYSFTKVVARYRHWWRLPKLSHSLSIEVLGGLIVGNAPLFSKFFVSDLNPLLPQRALDLNFSTLPSRNLFNTVIDSMRYEDVTAKIALEYSVTFFRRKSVFYRGNFFVRTGTFALFSREHLRQRESSLRAAIPVDLTLDVGVRFDTAVGVFTVSIANALGRIPL